MNARLSSRIGYSIVVAIVSGLASAAHAGDTSLSSALNELLGGEGKATKTGEKPRGAFEIRVVAGDDNEPVGEAKVAVAHVSEGFIHYGGPDSVQAYSPSQQTQWGYGGEQSAVPTAMDVTLADGRVTFTGLMAGKYNLIASHSTLGVAVLRDVILKRPRGGEPLEVRLETPASIEGVIKGLTGSKDSRYGYAVPFSTSCGKGGINVRLPVEVGEDGTFRTPAVPVGGRWTLTISAFVRSRGFAAPLVEWPVDVTFGRKTEVTIDLTAGPSVTGQVLGPDGKALENVSVVVARPGYGRESQLARIGEAPKQSKVDLAGATAADRPKQEPVFSGKEKDGLRRFGVLTGADGKFRIGGLTTGDYRLEAKRWTRRTEPG